MDRLAKIAADAAAKKKLLQDEAAVQTAQAEQFRRDAQQKLYFIASEIERSIKESLNHCGFHTAKPNNNGYVSPFEASSGASLLNKEINVAYYSATLKLFYEFQVSLTWRLDDESIGKLLPVKAATGTIVIGESEFSLANSQIRQGGQTTFIILPFGIDPNGGTAAKAREFEDAVAKVIVLFSENTD